METSDYTTEIGETMPIENAIFTPIGSKSFSELFFTSEHFLELFLDIFLHCSILFIFLGSFFIFFVSKTEKKVMEEQLSNQIIPITDDIKNIPDYSIFVDKYRNDILIQKNKYKNVASNVKENNDTVKKNIMITSACLIGIFILLLLFKRVREEIKPILIANIIIFTFVGMIEFGFFTKVAMNYVPAPPSLMVSSIKTDIMSNPKFN